MRGSRKPVLGEPLPRRQLGLADRYRDFRLRQQTRLVRERVWTAIWLVVGILALPYLVGLFGWIFGWWPLS